MNLRKKITKKKGEPNKSHGLLYNQEDDKEQKILSLLCNLLCVWNKPKNSMGNTPIRTTVWKKYANTK